MPASNAQTRASSATKAGHATTEISNYRLERRLGQEELTTVFRATHLTLDRPVHLHILRRTDWVSVSRFQLAARLSARLNHPNLLPVIDAGHDSRHGDYFVTPAMEAQPLSDALQEGSLDALFALRVASQIAAALDYLHQEKVIHRDVQPANITVTPQGLAYLTGMGLASSPDAPDLSSVDETDYLTPYSAPEQRFEQSDASPALDIYGLGATLYAMLTGETPPAPGTALSSLAHHDPALSGVDRVLQRMMAMQPDSRFPSAGMAITALRQSLRTQIDLATDDMEESRWEASAEWLENPLEKVLGDTLEQEFQDFVARSRKRADDLHRRDAIRRLVNRWSRNGIFRRASLGQIIQPEQIVSYNVYFFELRTQYETRTAPQIRERPQKSPDENGSYQDPPSVWEMPIPEDLLQSDGKSRELVLPYSVQVRTCPGCSGISKITCKTCKGKGVIERVRKVSNPDSTSGEEVINQTCPHCHGYGKQNCSRCAGMGNIVEEQVFTCSRRARLWENTDDLEGLPILALQKRKEQVYSVAVNPYEGYWHSIAPLAELLRAAIADVANDTRLIAADLRIKGTPITELEYKLNDKSHRLYFVGFDNELIGDWSLINPERVALVTIFSVLALVIVMIVVVWIAF